MLQQAAAAARMRMESTDEDGTEEGVAALRLRLFPSLLHSPFVSPIFNRILIHQPLMTSSD